MKRYEEVVQLIRRRIASGVLRQDDRVPSVRQMRDQTGFSAMTVQHAYALLESEGLLVARPRSGFFVARDVRRPTPFPTLPMTQTLVEGEPLSLTARLYRNFSDTERQRSRLADVSISADLVPAGTLRKIFQHALRSNTPYEAQVEGSPVLRDLVARRCLTRGIEVGADDIVMAGNVAYALQLCLRTMTRPGSVVLVESPSYFPLFGALSRLDLRALEIYSHPATGVDPEQLAYLLAHNPVGACILSPTFHFPTGIAYPPDNMRRIVEHAARAGVPIIEVDAYGELGYSDSAPASLKMFDGGDNVTHIGSFAATFGQRYGLAWIAGGRFRRDIAEAAFFDNPFGMDGALQKTIATFLTNHNYERHLRRTRALLAARMATSLEHLDPQLPPRSSISQAQGGFMCWVRLPPSASAVVTGLLRPETPLVALPGPIFSVSGSFRNFVGLNLSHPCDAEQRQALDAFADCVNTGGTAPR